MVSLSRCVCAAVMTFVLSGQGSVAQIRPTHDGKVVLFGNLHAHSKLSDDVTHTGANMTPAAAFVYAQAHGIDFLAISDHHKATDSNHRLFLTPTEYETELFQAAMNHNTVHAGNR